MSTNKIVLHHPKYILEHYHFYIKNFKPYLTKNGEICLNKSNDNTAILKTIEEFAEFNDFVFEENEYCQWWIPVTKTKYLYGYTYTFIENLYHNKPTIVVWDRIVFNDKFYYREEFINDTSINSEIKQTVLALTKEFGSNIEPMNNISLDYSDLDRILNINKNNICTFPIAIKQLYASLGMHVKQLALDPDENVRIELARNYKHYFVLGNTFKIFEYLPLINDPSSKVKIELIDSDHLTECFIYDKDIEVKKHLVKKNLHLDYLINDKSRILQREINEHIKSKTQQVLEFNA